MNKHCISLELDKILKMLSDTASSADAKEKALEIKPLTDYFEVLELLDKTEAAYIFIAKFGAPSFGGLQNVNNALSRAAAGGSLSAGELLKIAVTLKIIRGITVWHEKCAGMETALDDLFNSLYPNKYLEERITNAILSETEISDNASPELKEIRRKKRHYENKIREQLDSMIHSSHYSKYLRDGIVTQRNGRFVVPVRAEHRGDVAGMVHDTSGSGATVFIEPAAVVEANNEIKVLESREIEEIERAVAKGDGEEIDTILSELDPSEAQAENMIATSLDSVEEQMKEKLTKLGYTVDTKLGNRNSRISLAVYDEKTDKYLVGVELDSDAFRASASAMERDVYKPRFLKARGWNVIRVWCRDWWLHPQKVIKSITSLAEKNK